MKAVDDFVTLSAKLGVVPSGVVPHADGGEVVVYFSESRKKRVEVEFLDSGEIVIGMDDGDQIQVNEIEEYQIRDYLLKIKSYFSL